MAFDVLKNLVNRLMGRKLFGTEEDTAPELPSDKSTPSSEAGAHTPLASDLQSVTKATTVPGVPNYGKAKDAPIEPPSVEAIMPRRTRPDISSVEDKTDFKASTSPSSKWWVFLGRMAQARNNAKNQEQKADLDNWLKEEQDRRTMERDVFLNKPQMNYYSTLDKQAQTAERNALLPGKVGLQDAKIATEQTKPALNVARTQKTSQPSKGPGRPGGASSGTPGAEHPMITFNKELLRIKTANPNIDPLAAIEQAKASVKGNMTDKQATAFNHAVDSSIKVHTAKTTEDKAKAAAENAKAKIALDKTFKEGTLGLRGREVAVKEGTLGETKAQNKQRNAQGWARIGIGATKAAGETIPGMTSTTTFSDLTDAARKANEQQQKALSDDQAAALADKMENSGAPTGEKTIDKIEAGAPKAPAAAPAAGAPSEEVVKKPSKYEAQRRKAGAK